MAYEKRSGDSGAESNSDERVDDVRFVLVVTIGARSRCV